MGVVKDRRRSARVMVRADAVLHLPRGRQVGRCLDLSTGGLLVLGPLRPRPGTRLEVEVTVEGRHLRLRAELVRSREVKAGHLFALRFVELDARQRAQLEEVVHGKLLRTAQAGGAVVLDLRALREAAAGTKAAPDRADSEPAPDPPPTEAAPSRHPPVHFQGDWFEDELVTAEMPAVEPARGGTVAAPAPADRGSEPGGTVVAKTPSEPGDTVVAAAPDRAEARPEGTVVEVAPQAVPRPEPTLVLEPTPEGDEARTGTGTESEPAADESHASGSTQLDPADESCTSSNTELEPAADEARANSSTELEAADDESRVDISAELEPTPGAILVAAPRLDRTLELPLDPAPMGSTVIAPAPRIDETAELRIDAGPTPAVPQAVSRTDSTSRFRLDRPRVAGVLIVPGLGPTEGTVVLHPPAADPEGTVVLAPVPAEPTVRYALGPPPGTARAETRPQSHRPADTQPHHLAEAEPHRLADALVSPSDLVPALLPPAPSEPEPPPPLASPRRDLESPPPPASLRSDLGPSDATPSAAPCPPRPSQLALRAAIELMRGRGPVLRPGQPPLPRVIVSLPHVHIPARRSPWSPSS